MKPRPAFAGVAGLRRARERAGSEPFAFQVDGMQVLGRKCTIFCRPARVLTLLPSEGDSYDDDFAYEEDFADVALSLKSGNLAACGFTDVELLDLLTRELGPEDYDVLLKLDETNVKKTVSADVLERLLKTTASAGHACLEESCGVCLIQFEAAEVVRCLPCKHFYHDECIRQWLSSCKNTCPLCGLELGTESDDERGDGSS